MTHLGRQFTLLIATVFSVVWSVGCRPDKTSDAAVLKVGVIASLSGPGEAWGRMTLSAAEVVAEYYNKRGGFEIDGQRYSIELIPIDDKLEPDLAVDAAQRLVFEEDVGFIIGPLGDDAVVAVAPILDVAKVVYLHYGFDPDLLRENSSGILGMPVPQQTLPIIFDYLQDRKGVKSLSIIARDSREGIHQKLIAEKLARARGFEIINFSEFDVIEETLDFSRVPDGVTEPILKVLEMNPDAVLLVGVPPDHLTRAVEAFRNAGYNKPLVTQNNQDVNLLMSIGQAAEGLIFVGGELPEVKRTVYFQQLKERYMQRFDSSSTEAAINFYALESILQFVRHIGGPDALKGVDLIEAMNTFEFVDPFFNDNRKVRLVGDTTFLVRRQLSTPIIISEIIGGLSQTVVVANLPE